MNKPQVKHYAAHGSGMIAYYDVAEMDAYLKQLEARVAILDAQKVGLPPTLEEFLHLPCEQWEEVTHSLLWSRMIQIYPQYLDAQRAVQAWREVARKMLDGLYDSPCDCLFKPVAGQAERKCIMCKRCEAIKAYDALAGKEGE